MSISKDKANAYIADRYPLLATREPTSAQGMHAVRIREDFRAGFMQGLEAARDALWGLEAEDALDEIRRMIGDEL